LPVQAKVIFSFGGLIMNF